MNEGEKNERIFKYCIKEKKEMEAQNKVAEIY